MTRAIASGSFPLAPVAAGGSRPWCERWIERSGLPPAVCGAVITASVLALMVCGELLSGELGRVWRGEASAYKTSEYRFSAIIALLLGYLPTTWVLGVRASRRAFADLRPVLRGSAAELDALGATLGHFDRRSLRRVGLVGIAFALVLPIAMDETFAVYGVGRLNSASLGHRLMVPIVLWLVARLTFASLVDARRLIALSRERLSIDLLDLGPLAPLSRYGLQSALGALGTVSIVSLLSLDWAARPGMPWVLSLLLAAALGIGAANLLLPLSGARTLIQRAKQRELDWCRERIRRRRAELEAGQAPESGGSLAELVAYRGLVSEVRSWPFDAPTLLRFALYLAIPIGSWLGGALAERLLDALLG